MKSSNTSLSAKKWLTGNCEPLFVYGALSQKCTLSFGVMMAQRKKSVDLHFLLHRHKAGGASPLGAACFEALAYVFASADASLRILMTPRQKNERFFAMVCQFKYDFSLSRCPQELERFYTCTAAGEVRQASCSKRLRKLSPRACFTFLCLL